MVDDVDDGILERRRRFGNNRKSTVAERRILEILKIEERKNGGD